MKLLFCLSPQTDDIDPNKNASKKDPSTVRVWFSSLRGGMKKRKRVSISYPVNEVPISKDLIQNKGFVDVKSPPNVGELFDFVDTANSAEDDDVVDSVIKKDKDTNENSVNNNNNLVNAETNTESTHNYIDYSCPSKETPIKDNINYGWFWGNVSRRDAENLLRGKEDGTFLVRESSDKRFLYSLTFRSNGKTMHTRIEHSNGMFSFYSTDSDPKRSNDGSSTLGGLISDAMNHNNTDGIFFYSRGTNMNSESLHTVTLSQPLSRHQYLIDYDYGGDISSSSSNNNQHHKSLQYMCKFIVHHSNAARQKVNSQLEMLPEQIKLFIEAPSYFPPIIKKLTK